MSGNAGKIIKYSALPGFIPRIFALATSGFSTLAFYIACVYNIVKLLPDDHLYLQKQNIGKYGVRHVIIAAAANLKFRRENIDQIIIFFTILTGLALIIIQIALFILALMAYQDAFALTFPVNHLFINPSGVTGSLGPEQDLAFIILDRVFGLVPASTSLVPSFDSCISVGVACEGTNGTPFYAASTAPYPYPFHTALHTMLQFYSLGIIAVGALLFVYFTMTIVGETASTGTPFGKRFNRAWAPIRFMLFFALIIPFTTGSSNPGLNGAQIIVFWAAKHGSNLATNGWAWFNTNLSAGTFMGPQQRLVADPNPPEMGALNQFILTAKVCSIVEKRTPHNKDIIPYIVRSTPPAWVGPIVPTGASGTASPDAMPLIGTPYGTPPIGNTAGTGALGFSLGGDINIRFGEIDPDIDGNGTLEKYTGYGGNVFPFCGDLKIITTDIFEPGSVYIAEQYYLLIETLWNDAIINDVAECIVRTTLTGRDVQVGPQCTEQPGKNYIDTVKAAYDAYVTATMTNALNLQRTDPTRFLMPPELIEKGWAGAAIWYNRIAEMNGAVVDAALNIPRSDKYPWAMQLVLEERRLQNQNTLGKNQYYPILSDGQIIRLPDGREATYPALYAAHNFWQEKNAADSAQTRSTGNAVLDLINLILGTSGIFDMRNNADINPLAQLTAIGKGMMEATIRNTAIAGAGYVGGGIAGIFGDIPKEIVDTITGFMWSMITVSIGISVILYYVLPLLPFIYFMFAVSGWVKSIFEAIVAMPLWALAHIRIDGEGIPGQDASNGYFLILEIFLRPILILFGLIASISIFSALVMSLNAVFDLLVANVGGFGVRQEVDTALALPTQLSFYRGPIDEFFFTAMYAIICYLMGISCFKLVDLIPNNILRWMGSNAATFQENAGDPAGQLTNNVYRGSILVSNQVKGATQGDLGAIVVS